MNLAFNVAKTTLFSFNKVIMNSVQQRSARGAGRGLFATRSVDAGQEILRVDRPLLAALDTPHLKDTCK